MLIVSYQLSAVLLTASFCLSAVLFYCYGIYAAIAFRRFSYPVNPEFHPPLTILKPLCGLDAETYTNLASFCQQYYPQYQIVFGVRDFIDPCIEIIEKLIQQFPNVDISLVVNDEIMGTNLKVSNLANAFTTAKHDILVIADSDIRVDKNYLQQIIQPLRDPGVGVVTCLYRSLAQGWVARLDAIGTATDFHAGVLVSNQLEGIKFALGSTIVIRQQVLEKIGGFEAIADYLADDFQLGHLSAQAGYQVLLSNYIVDHVLDTSSLKDTIKRQIRWARCIRVSRPWGYLGLVFTYGTVFSLLLLITSGGSIFAWTTLVITWGMRLVMAWVVGVKVLHDPVAKKFLWLIPFRDLLHFFIWCYSFFGSTIEWRKQRMKLTHEGKLVV
ncbi:bacteriohopanetetrol glucosamine biosynthesis glycosyltransferase HpnI [Anabaena sp. PCC 7108]|uniref:bacteriohopanetetrol glucosamine biosynthesis glycosyltransferase HpnI n=1 Tax=Anabaena sp. PCC 7108 TaxID=163908 RepID=UPI00036CA505